MVRASTAKTKATRARSPRKPRGTDAELHELARAVWAERTEEREARRRELEADPFVQKARVIVKNLEIAIEAATDPSRNRHQEALRPWFERHVRSMAYAELLVAASPHGPTLEQRLHALFQTLTTNCRAYAEDGALSDDAAKDAARMAAQEYAFAFPDSPLEADALLPVVTCWLDTRRGRKPTGVLGKYGALRAALQATKLKRYSAAALSAEHAKWRRAKKRNS